MTIESEIAKDVGYRLEAKKDGLKQVQSGDVKLTITVQACDMPGALYNDPMGQRYVVVMVPINDDETPRIKPDKPKSLARAAVMMLKDESFERYFASINGLSEIKEGHAETWLKDECGIKSKSELIEGTEAGNRFRKILSNYQFWLNN